MCLHAQYVRFFQMTTENYIAYFEILQESNNTMYLPV